MVFRCLPSCEGEPEGTCNPIISPSQTMSTPIVNNRLSHYHPAQSAPLLVKEGINQVLSLIRRGGGVVFVFFLFYFFLTNPANAGLILNHPNYTGLNAGLVGFWSFDGKDMAALPACQRLGRVHKSNRSHVPPRPPITLHSAVVVDGD